MTITDLRIGVFAYNFPHKKTNDFLYRMLTDQIPVSLILAADPVKLPLQPSAVKTKVRHQGLVHSRQIADTFGIPYEVFPHNSVETIEKIKEHRLDLGIIAGARILKAEIIDAFPMGVINFHPGILPAIRGLDALLWSIEKDVPLGITSHLIDRRVDAGLLIEKFLIPIYKDDTAFDLTERLQEYQLDMIGRSIKKVLEGKMEEMETGQAYNRKMDGATEVAVLNKLPNFIARYATI
ncbi:MAG: hypothetical protein JWP88_2064 [Flaviaesturariibacter sp.]|nr:hypothetical protein [Flaviaesturariibacter sp.]